MEVSKRDNYSLMCSYGCRKCSYCLNNAVKVVDGRFTQYCKKSKYGNPIAYYINKLKRR